MAYATIANGGMCYYPRLVDKILKQDGSPVFDEQGNPVSAIAARAIGFTAGNPAGQDRARAQRILEGG